MRSDPSNAVKWLSLEVRLKSAQRCRYAVETYLEEVVAGALHGADSGALLKDTGYLRVHLDVEVPF